MSVGPLGELASSDDGFFVSPKNTMSGPGLGLGLAETLEEGDAEALGESEGDTDADGEAEAEGDSDAEGDPAAAILYVAMTAHWPCAVLPVQDHTADTAVVAETILYPTPAGAYVVPSGSLSRDVYPLAVTPVWFVSAFSATALTTSSSAWASVPVGPTVMVAAPVPLDAVGVLWSSALEAARPENSAAHHV